MRTFKILFVDDDLGPFVRKIRDFLRKSSPSWILGFASTPEQGQKVLEKAADYDAVVLDLDLKPGGGGGLSLLGWLRSHRPSTAAVLLTSANDRLELARAFLDATVAPGFGVRELDPEEVVFKSALGTPKGLSLLQAAIERSLFRVGRVENEEAILVTHGTDTMAWGLAYLRYALKGLTMNVALTGSQIPLEGFFSVSDALGNLKTSLQLLNRLRPAHLFAVFQEGQVAYSGRLHKVRKWSTAAFDGRISAKLESDHLHSMRHDWVHIPYADQKLDRLHLVRTGGTIESKPSASGSLKPTADFVWRYLNDTLSGYFTDPVRHDLLALDSSNMGPEQWAKVARQIERVGGATADTAFDLGVIPVYTNPLMTAADYSEVFSKCPRGAILLGYGGGNGNTLRKSERSVLPAIQAATEQGKYIAVGSQVPMEVYDIDYDTGRQLLEAGGIPCGDLPLAEAQMKLSYILGHDEVTQRLSATYGITPRELVIGAFLSGVSMRKPESMDLYRTILKKRKIRLAYSPEDILVGRSFEAAMAIIAETVTSKI